MIEAAALKDHGPTGIARRIKATLGGAAPFPGRARRLGLYSLRFGSGSSPFSGKERRAPKTSYARRRRRAAVAESRVGASLAEVLHHLVGVVLPEAGRLLAWCGAAMG